MRGIEFFFLNFEIVSPLQGLGKLNWHVTRAFSPGYHMAGFQPLGLCLCGFEAFRLCALASLR